MFRCHKGAVTDQDERGFGEPFSIFLRCVNRGFIYTPFCRAAWGSLLRNGDRTKGVLGSLSRLF